MEPLARCAAGLTVALLAWLFLLAPQAVAHERREAAGYQVVVGWQGEPPFAGFMNAVSIRVSSGTEPVEGLRLSVEVLFGDKDATERKGPLDLRPASNDPGHYSAPIMPTRPGRYTFHVAGLLGRQTFDEYFTSGESTFDEVLEPRLLQFPAQDPSAGELGSKTDRAVARASEAIESVRNASQVAELSRILALAGAGVGTLGLVIASAALRRSSRK